jgi:hypothetical protein
MGNFIYQSTLVQASFYREIPVDQQYRSKRKAPDIASWGSITANTWSDSDFCFMPSLTLDPTFSLEDCHENQAHHAY